MRALRLARQETALLIALADLGGAADVVATTRALSDAADAFIKAALRFVLREVHRAGNLQLASVERSRDRLRPDHSRARQAWRVRAELFERCRSRDFLRSRNRRLSPAPPIPPAFRAADQALRQTAAGAHRRLLCAASRFAAAARPRLDGGRGRPSGAPMAITRCSARTGSARPNQGAPGGGRHRARPRFSRRR